MSEHISYSEVKIWKECPWKHKLQYIDKIKGFRGNEYTAFGTAIHDVCEKLARKDISNNEQASLLFDQAFASELHKLKEVKEIDKKMVVDMRTQGKNLIPSILPELNKVFEKYNIHSTEYKLYESIEEHNKNFKGYIDLVLKLPDDKYIILDWKTCSWGWDSRKKSDKMINYQLTLYKHFFAKRHNIDPKNIETYFALLKRTAKKDNTEIFRVTSGPKKTKNALNLLKKALHNIEKGNFIKNRLSCRGCDFYKTEYCT